MVNIMQSLYTAQDALRANQGAMSVVSNNIANMNTVGYSKQRVDMESVNFNPGSINQLAQIPTGTVAIEKVTRYQDEFLNSFIMQENSGLGYDTKSTEVLKSLDPYFNEIQGTGLTGALNDYFAATQELSNDPTNKVVRSNFVTQADAVSTALNSKYTQLNDYRTALVGDGVTVNPLNNSQIGKLTVDINGQLTQIAELNKQISVFSDQQGNQPNALLDKRQLLLEDLAKQIPITSKVEGNSLNVYVGNIQLIYDGKQVASFKATVGNASEPTIISIVNNTTVPSTTLVPDYKAAFSQSQGEMKALLDAGGSGVGSISSFITQLNTLAREFATSVNDIQLKRAYNGGGVITDASLKTDPATNTLSYATENIFLNGVTPNPYDPTTITAGNIIVNQVIKNNPFEVATAYAPVNAGPPITPVNPNAVGNNNNAISFATMRDKSIASLGGSTVENYYYSTISEVGINTSLANNKLTSQQASLTQLTDKKQSLVGVNLDEELVDLMKYQKAYQASAQVFSTVNQMLSVIMSMGK